MKVTFTKAAYEIVGTEVGRYPDHETGCVLVGKRTATEFMVTDAIVPGPRATHQVALFENDADYQNEQLKQLRQNNPQIDYIGSLHRHPGAHIRPSAWDGQQAIAILNDPDYKIGGVLLVVIAVIHQTEVQLYPYQMTQDQPEFVPLEWEISRDAEGKRRASKPKPLPAEPTDGLISASHDRCCERLEQEIAAIAELGIETSIRHLQMGLWAMRLCEMSAQKQTSHVDLVFPCEYPLKPPRVIYQHKQDFREYHSPLLDRWSSAYTLVELVEELVSNKIILVHRRELRWWSIKVRPTKKGGSHDVHHVV